MKIKPEVKQDIKKFIKERLRSKQQEITIVSPYNLTKEEIQDIIQRYPQLAKKKIVQQVDQQILAGVIIKQGTKILDLSLAKKIKTLHNIVNEIT